MSGTEITRELLLAGPDRPVTSVEVEGLGRVFVRAMSGHELDLFSRRDKADNKGIESLGILAAFTLCHADGTRMFAPEESEIILTACSTETLRALCDHSLKLNKLEAQVELKKNS